MYLEEKIDKLIELVEKLDQRQIPLPVEPKPKAKGKKPKAKEPEVVEEAKDVTPDAEALVSYETLKDKIIGVAGGFDDGRNRVKAIFKKLKVDTAADLKPEQWAECYGLLAKEK